MTPLHVMACSTVQNIELYKVLVTKYPETLITEDKWGSLPLVYAVLRNAPTKKAPSEIVQFLVDSYKSLYPNRQFNWNELVLNLARFESLANPTPEISHDVIRYVWGIQKETYLINILIGVLYLRWQQIVGTKIILVTFQDVLLYI